MPYLACLIRQGLVTHFPIVFHINQTAVAQEPGNGSVIQMDEADDLSLQCAVLQEALRILITYKNVFRNTFL